MDEAKTFNAITAPIAMSAYLVYSSMSCLSASDKGSPVVVVFVVLVVVEDLVADAVALVVA
eukprot:CAMPEP_0178818712 /NCGR_PEP_ID=MMETSP0746-20121128/2577_1 /TAXON_ID=913974 /ORGANISM="Nitzschia punctata, Strain CCMP561" /LENGTH=60 /DNA_ID=CAMNT_0020479913 /DNA_START=588 /DNA_END=766 /DNA_ORIENTATION=+